MIKQLKKVITLCMLGVMTIGMGLSSNVITAFAHNSYFLAITIDEANFQYRPTVIYEDNGNLSANNHKEANIGDFTSSIVNNMGVANNFQIPDDIDRTKVLNEQQILEKYHILTEEDSNAGGKYIPNIPRSIFVDGDRGMAFTFPGLHGRDFGTDKNDANAKDEESAYFIAENLVGDFNDTISWIIEKSGGIKKFNTSQLQNYSAKLSNLAGNVIDFGAGSQELEIKNNEEKISKFIISKVYDSSKVKCIEGKTTIDNYIKITITTNGETSEKYALYKVSKRYENREDLSAKYRQQLRSHKSPEFLNWKFIVLQGNFLADYKNIRFSTVNNLTKPGEFEKAISQLFSSALGGLRNLLGFYPMEDVILNGGGRNTGYYFGVMPKAWMNSSQLLNFVCQIIAWTIMGFALVRMLFKRQLATVNIGQRISLMEGIKDIFITCFLLLTFPIIFHFMVRINYSLVDIFEASSKFSSYIGTATNMTSGLFSAILINIAFFAINGYFNIVYVLRAFTVAMLYGMAPLAIISLSFGGNYKTIFSNFIKELVANIFLQTFHAMCIAFFTSITSTSQMRTFELFTVLMALIPLTNFIRSNIVGLPGGITEQATGMLSTGKSLAMGAVGGLAGGKMAQSGASGSSGPSGSGANSKIANSINSGKSADTSRAGQMMDKAKGTPQISNSSLKSGMSDGSGPLSTNGTSKHIASSQQQFGKKALGAVAKGVAGMASAGSAIGLGAVGDKRGMEQFSKLTGGAIQGMKNSLADDTEDINSAGGKDLYSDQESMTMVMNDYNGKFNDSNLNGTGYESNFNEMADCFLKEGNYASGGSKESDRDNAKKYYKSQGIQGVGRNSKGNTAIAFDKKMASKRNFSLKDVGNIPTFNSKL